MRSLWDDRAAAKYEGDLAQRVYTSRLLGREPALVLHGGGNTSVKTTQTSILGEQEEILYVKGSGWDLATIEGAGFAPVRMKQVLGLAELPELSDTQMANELKSSMTNASAPGPSVETILHAILPHKFVDHTHADTVIAVTNTPSGRERIKQIYGNSVVIIPYIMPGFQLAKLCAELFPQQAGPDTIGMVLMNHGVFSFGATARIAYERMIDLVTRAEQYLSGRDAWQISYPSVSPVDKPLRQELAALRRQVSQTAGFPVVLMSHRDELSLAFTRRDDLGVIARQGPATPDHVLRTKRLPLVGRDVTHYQTAYTQYFQTHAANAAQKLVMVDPAPRVILDPDLGVCTVGRTVKEAAVVADIYQHTMAIILRATALEAYQALPAQDIFDVEYWDLEQAKLRRQPKPSVFTGEVALITGAASGIGKACAEAMLARGAAVIGLDVNPAVATTFQCADFLGLVCDVTRSGAIDQALEAGVRQFGGLDMLILNAGIFAQSRPIEALTLADWRKVMDVNLDANLVLMSLAYPLLKLAPQGGRMVVVGSKNVAAPGPGAAAYSASKAALNQLARVAAMEWGQDGIRVNVVPSQRRL